MIRPRHIYVTTRDAIAGVVDKEVDVNARASQFLDNRRCGVRLRQISRDDVDLHAAALPQGRRELIEALAAARREHQPVSLVSQQFGKGFADAGRRARHERRPAASFAHLWVSLITCREELL